MGTWFRQLDDLLRGRKTGLEHLAEDRIDLPLRVFLPMAVVLGAAYGLFMGWYALFNHAATDYRFVLSAMLKIPALFLLTLVVTFPSLYVFNALVGCRLSWTATQRLLVGAIVVNLTVAASFGPILGFFTVSTTSYSFMVLLNVALLAVAGVVGLTFLLHTLRRLASPGAGRPPERPADRLGQVPADAADAGARPLGPLDPLPVATPQEALGQARGIFQIWVLLYSLVGAQMGWLLRPFIGSPHLPFEWFRARHGNFFQAVLQQLANLLGGN